MAETRFGTNDRNTQQKWSDKLFRRGMGINWFSRLMGTSENSAIQVDKDLTKGIGDKVNFRLLALLTGDGIGDDGTIKGNGEALKVGNFRVEVHERGHSVEAGGRISTQRTSTNIREDGKAALALWQKQIIEHDLVMAASGLYNVNTGIATVNEKLPSSARIWRGGQAVAGTIATPAGYASTAALTAATEANTYFGLTVVDLIKIKMMEAQPQFRPIIDPMTGEEHFFCLVSRRQAWTIRLDANWKVAVAYARERGKTNPLFTGSLAVHNNVILYECDKIQSRLGAGGTLPSEGFVLNTGRTATSDAAASGRRVARAIFFGAQGMVMAWAQMPSWLEGHADVKPRKPLVATDMLYGISKTRFNDHGTTTAQQDFGIFVCETHEPTLG